jgi:hypothetical protein
MFEDLPKANTETTVVGAFSLRELPTGQCPRPLAMDLGVHNFFLYHRNGVTWRMNPMISRLPYNQ